MKRTFGFYAKSMIPGFEERGLIFKKQVFVPEKALAQVAVGAGVAVVGAVAEAVAQAAGKRVRRWLDERAAKARVKENQARRGREERGEERAAAGAE